MGRWLLTVAVVALSAVASAQPTQRAPLAAATESAAVIAKTTEQQVAQLMSRRAELAARYQDELDAIDRLKKQHASWRRDRELRESMSSYADTANQLTVVDNEIIAARQNLADARRGYLTVLDKELSTAVAPPRRVTLERARRALLPQIAEAPRRIVVPDLDVDPLADPEELDQRAGELRATEIELGHQLAGLEAQAAALDHLAQLRKQHDRAGDLFNRDDDEPHRNTVYRSSEGGTGETTGNGNHLPTTPVWTSPGFETAVPVVLADVLDTSTLKTFAAAERSGDPAQRAEAARKAHDAVAKRIEQVQKRRAEFEARAKQLRNAH